ncbi:hypothetical protein PISMIDRAFT_673185 [Pisolithus microcarpus 441]|uniref:C2H2-type domain-containing protein n=1 Tax=Pisolithus microcarpus 441 TaxID=765257 RepID=A0A0D0AAB4_9AGAM|nr:hypothetical protein BKA83DRAFT_673185 [Pisolithus microcarpus]KIK28918.1 hypothetical protein PISMIDRAFT_673185 [Pisolithus microcarpus 441]
MADSSYAYNHDFNDEDQQNLVRYASLPPDKKHYECGWVVFNNVCGVLVPGESFAAHLREAHGIFGNDKTKFKCQWVDCGLQMNKESVGRHVAESHLLYRYPCPYCGEIFSRKNTLNGHLRKKHFPE